MIDSHFKWSSDKTERIAALLRQFQGFVERDEPACIGWCTLHEMRYYLEQCKPTIDAANDELAGVSLGELCHGGIYGRRCYSTAHQLVMDVAAAAVQFLFDISGFWPDPSKIHGVDHSKKEWEARFKIAAANVYEHFAIDSQRMTARIQIERGRVIAAFDVAQEVVVEEPGEREPAGDDWKRKLSDLMKGAPKVAMLIKYLREIRDDPSSDGWVDFCDLAERVWGDELTKNANIKMRLSSANKKLEQAGAPLRILTERERARVDYF